MTAPVDLRLAIPGVFGWLAAGLLIGAPGYALPVAIVLWMLGALLVAAAFVRPRAWLSVAALAAMAAALCCTSVAMALPARIPGALAEAATSGRQVSAAATTSETLLPGTGSFRVTLSDVTIGGTTVVGSIPVLVFGDRPDVRVGIGSTLRLTGTLSAADSGEDIAFLMFSSGTPKFVAPPPWYLSWANSLRAGFGSAAAELPGDGGDLLPGLAIGDTTSVSDGLDSAMKSTSLSHLTAVSGANCAVVIALVMAMGGAFGLPRWARIGGSVAILVAFVVLVTPEPSVLRAAVMAALVLASMLSGRPVRGIPVLAVASIGLLVSDPWLARSYGFGLSVLATGGLLLMAGPLASMLERWLPRKLALVIAVPLAAQLACQPVIILLNASLPAYGVLANTLAEPAAPIATVLGLAACVTLPLVPPLGSVLSQLAWIPSAWIAAVAQFFSGLPGAQLPWPPGALGVLLLLILTALAVFAMLWRGLRWRWFALGLVLCVLAYAGIVGGSRVGDLLNRPTDWEIAGCDVGQGDSFLVRSRGQTALIDTGREPALMTKCLRELGISHIDLLVLTHYDLDHVGGAPAVVGMVTRAFVGPSQGAKSDRLVTSLLGGGAQVQQVSRGPTGVLGDLRWAVLWPPQRLDGIEPGNPASVTVLFTPLVSCACLSSIFLGDLGEDAQNRVLAANPSLGRVDVVKVSHHGSADQSSKLYERLQATVGLIGVGVDNGYGHPTQTLLDILARVGTVPKRTDQHGLLLVSAGSTPGSVNVWTQK